MRSNRQGTSSATQPWLYQNRRLPSALGLALLSREEIGKARILLRFLEQGRVGLTFRELQHEIEKHSVKQQAGVIVVAVPVNDRQFLAAMFPESEDDEARAARAEADDLADRLARRLPSERTRLRERAFYVDAAEGAWSRPASLSEQQVHKELLAANYDYALFARAVRDAHAEFSWLRDYLDAWSDRPALPPPPLAYPGSSMAPDW